MNATGEAWAGLLLMAPLQLPPLGPFPPSPPAMLTNVPTDKTANMGSVASKGSFIDRFADQPESADVSMQVSPSTSDSDESDLLEFVTASWALCPPLPYPHAPALPAPSDQLASLVLGPKSQQCESAPPAPALTATVGVHPPAAAVAS